MDNNEIAVSNNGIPSEKHEQNSVLKVVSNIISWIFHPIWMPPTVAIVISLLAPNSFVALTTNTKMQWLAIIVLNTVFFPLLATALMKALGFIESIKMKTSKDRIMPLIASMIFYFWAYQVFKNFQSPQIFKIFFLGNFLGIIGVFMANIFIKISMHTAAAGGALGAVLILAFIGKINIMTAIIVFTIIAGIIGTARILLKAHKPSEVWLGYVVGILSQFIAYWWL